MTTPADQGRPRSSDVVGYWPALISRDAIDMRVRVGDAEEAVLPAAAFSTAGPRIAPERVVVHVPSSGTPVTVPLRRLCLARSGDKADTCNIGVIARSPAIYGWMVEHLTAGFVREHFRELCRGGVDRYELPNLLSMNFLLHESLGGGGTLSIRLDAQGKTYAQYLLTALVSVDQALIDQPDQLA
jgi:hypothetical protein